MELKDVYPGMIIKVERSNMISDAHVINNLPEQGKIALKITYNGFYREHTAVFSYGDPEFKNFKLLNVIRKVEGNRAPPH